MVASSASDFSGNSSYVGPFLKFNFINLTTSESLPSRSNAIANLYAIVPRH